MDRRNVREAVAKAMLVLAGLGVAVLLVEVGVRWNFYSESRVVPGPAQMRLYRGLNDDYENQVNPWYRLLAAQAENLVQSEGAAAVLDYSDLLADEKPTTFADQWHFSDFGHAILADALARDLPPLLRQIGSHDSRSGDRDR